MKTVIWTDVEKMIPGIGVARRDESIALPDEIANSFIAQGKAKPAETIGKPKKPKLEEGE